MPASQLTIRKVEIIHTSFSGLHVCMALEGLKLFNCSFLVHRIGD